MFVSNLFLFTLTVGALLLVDGISSLAGLISFATLTYLCAGQYIISSIEDSDDEDRNVGKGNCVHNYILRLSRIAKRTFLLIDWLALLKKIKCFCNSIREICGSVFESSTRDDSTVPSETAANFCGDFPSTQSELNTVVNNILRDYIRSWYNVKISENKDFVDDVGDVIQSTLFSLSSKVSEVQFDKLISQLLEIYLHFFHHFKSAVAKVGHHNNILEVCLTRKEDIVNNFEMHHWAMKDQMSEWCYLQSITSTLIDSFGPVEVRSCHVVHSVITEIVAHSVMFPLVRVCTDPNKLNMWILKLVQNVFKVENINKSSEEKQIKVDLLLPYLKQSIISQPTILLTQDEPKVDSDFDTSSSEESSVASNSSKMDVHFESISNVSKESLECNQLGMGDSELSPAFDGASLKAKIFSVSSGSFCESNDDNFSGNVTQKQEYLHLAQPFDKTLMKRSKSADHIRDLTCINTKIPFSSSSLKPCSKSYSGSLPRQSTSGTQPENSEESRVIEVPDLFEDIRIVGTQHVEDFGHNPYTLYCIQYKGLFQNLSDDASGPSLVRETVKVCRRFREFSALHSRLESNPIVKPYLKGIRGPIKDLTTPFSNMNKSKITRRRMHLEAYLRRLCKHPVIARSSELQEFLAYGGDASIAFVKKPMISFPRINKVINSTMRSAIDFLRTALPTTPLERMVSPKIGTMNNIQENVCDIPKFPDYVLEFGKRSTDILLNLEKVCSSHLGATVEIPHHELQDIFSMKGCMQRLMAPEHSTENYSSCSCHAFLPSEDSFADSNRLACVVIDIIVSSLHMPQLEPSSLMMNLFKILPPSLLNKFFERKLEGVDDAKRAPWLHSLHRNIWPEQKYSPKPIDPEIPMFLSDIVKNALKEWPKSGGLLFLPLKSFLDYYNVTGAIELSLALLLGSLQNEKLNKCVFFFMLDEVMKALCGKVYC